MMTRKHVTAVAGIIQSARKNRIWGDINNKDRVEGWNSALDTMAENLSIFFAEDNPRFDEHKFTIACQEWADELP